MGAAGCSLSPREPVSRLAPRGTERFSAGGWSTEAGPVSPRGLCRFRARAGIPARQGALCPLRPGPPAAAAPAPGPGRSRARPVRSCCPAECADLEGTHEDHQLPALRSSIARSRAVCPRASSERSLDSAGCACERFPGEPVPAHFLISNLNLPFRSVSLGSRHCHHREELSAAPPLSLVRKLQAVMRSEYPVPASCSVQVTAAPACQGCPAHRALCDALKILLHSCCHRC